MAGKVVRDKKLEEYENENDYFLWWSDKRHFPYNCLGLTDKDNSVSRTNNFVNVNGPIYTGDGSSVEKDHPSSINTGRTMRRIICVRCDSSRFYIVFIVYWKGQLASCNEV